MPLPYKTARRVRVMSDLMERLRASQLYSDNISGDDDTPCLMQEAADKIAELEAALRDLLNDCINFDGGKLTDFYMERATAALQDSTEGAGDE
jgi:hypothetical protein